MERKIESELIKWKNSTTRMPHLFMSVFVSRNDKTVTDKIVNT